MPQIRSSPSFSSSHQAAIGGSRKRHIWMNSRIKASHLLGKFQKPSLYHSCCCSIQSLFIGFFISLGIVLLCFNLILDFLIVWNVVEGSQVVMILVASVSLVMWLMVTCLCSSFQYAFLIYPMRVFRSQFDALAELRIPRFSRANQRDSHFAVSWKIGSLSIPHPLFLVSNVYQCMKSLKKLNHTMRNVFSFLPAELLGKSSSRVAVDVNMEHTVQSSKLETKSKKRSKRLQQRRTSITPSISAHRNRIAPSPSRKSLVSVDSVSSFSMLSSRHSLFKSTQQEREHKFTPGLSVKELSFLKIRIHNVYELSVQEFVKQYALCLDIISESIEKVNITSSADSDLPIQHSGISIESCATTVESFTEECITIVFRQEMHQLAALETALEIDYRLRSIDFWLDITLALSVGTVITGTLGNTWSRSIRSFGTAVHLCNQLTHVAKSSDVSLVCVENMVQKTFSGGALDISLVEDRILRRPVDLLLAFPTHPGERNITTHTVIQLFDLNILKDSNCDLSMAISTSHGAMERKFELTNQCWQLILNSEFAQALELMESSTVLPDPTLQRIKYSAEFCREHSLEWDEFLEKRRRIVTENRQSGVHFASLLLSPPRNEEVHMDDGRHDEDED